MGTDPTMQFLERFRDPSQWVMVPNVPICRPHVRDVKRPDGSKDQIVVTAQHLPLIVAQTRRREQSGVVPVVTLGHRQQNRPDFPEENQPPIVGYAPAHDWTVGTFGPDNTPGILANLYYRLEDADEARKYPHRSMDFYRDGVGQIEPYTITGVALLKRDPWLNLGMVTYCVDPTPPFAPTSYVLNEWFESDTRTLATYALGSTNGFLPRAKPMDKKPDCYEGDKPLDKKPDAPAAKKPDAGAPGADAGADPSAAAAPAGPPPGYDQFKAMLDYAKQNDPAMKHLTDAHAAHVAANPGAAPGAAAPGAPGADPAAGGAGGEDADALIQQILAGQGDTPQMPKPGEQMDADAEPKRGMVGDAVRDFVPGGNTIMDAKKHLGFAAVPDTDAPPNRKVPMSTMQADAGPATYEARVVALETQLREANAKAAQQEARAIVYHLQREGVEAVGGPGDATKTGQWVDAFAKMSEPQRKAKTKEMLDHWKRVEPEGAALAYTSQLVDPMGFLPVSETTPDSPAAEFTEEDLPAAQAYMAQHPNEGWPKAREHALKHRNGRPRKAASR